jgi:predicted phosphodiesterase
MEKITDRILFASAIISFLLSIMIIMATYDMFEHGLVFILLAFLGVVISLVGIIGSLSLLFKLKKTGVILLRYFCIIGIIYSIFFVIIDNSNMGFLVFTLLWVILLFFFSRKSIKIGIGLDETPEKFFRKGKYLRMSRILWIFIFLAIMFLAGIWMIDWEKKAGIFQYPNAGGVSMFTNEGVSPDITAVVTGGFVYSVEDEIEEQENENVQNPIGELTIKLVSPDANISIIPRESGILRLNLLNFNPEKSEVTLNNEQAWLNKYNGAEFWQNALKARDENEISNAPLSGNFLLMKKGYFIDIKADEGKTLNIAIKNRQDNPKDEKILFYVISDTHSGYNIFLPALADILQENPEFIVWNGDITNNGYPAEYTIAAAIAESLPVQVFPTIGNHDVWNRGDKIYSQYFGPYYYSFIYKNTKFIFTDSSTGVIGDSQFKWIVSELEDSREKKCSHIIVFSHMPPIDTKTGSFDSSEPLHPELVSNIHLEAETEYLLELMKEYQVDAFVGSHTHEHGMKIQDNTIYVTSGVLGGSISAGDSVSYLQIDVSHENVEIKEVEVIASEDVESDVIGGKLQSAKIFAVPFMINKSVRITCTIVMIIICLLAWRGLRKFLVFEKE